ncbi:hypothetical protein GMD78_12290 [Ornithinibacillus sp. L9]|uniref:Uncharacterized protein n=2 Tax=Ornithinibacillus caprae TaxID=2678566 RepID=A0A6N8FHK3_9BACI|nr:hypothetical protein [Ornithinibacillus caprae]
MYGNDLYKEMEVSEQDKLIFNASELLKDNYDESKLSVRVVALQSLYMLEGEDEEYSKLKRHGVKSYSVKGVSVTFEGTNISPEVVSILGNPKNNKATVGRLI